MNKRNVMLGKAIDLTFRGLGEKRNNKIILDNYRFYLLVKHLSKRKPMYSYTRIREYVLSEFYQDRKI